MPKRSLLLLLATLLSTPAHAVSITVGWWDNTVPGGVHQIYTQPSFTPFTLNNQNFGPTFWGVLSAGLFDGGWYESAINNVFSTTTGTARIYTTFSGVTVTGDNPITFPTLFQRSENTLPGWTLVEQVFICGAGQLFCDNYINPVGTLIGNDFFTGGRTGNDYMTLTGIAPGQPFNITEVFHIVSSGADAHLAGAILVDPVASVPVPGPVVGAGLPA
jgi:hypothetical protein